LHRWLDGIFRLSTKQGRVFPGPLLLLFAGLHFSLVDFGHLAYPNYTEWFCGIKLGYIYHIKVGFCPKKNNLSLEHQAVIYAAVRKPFPLKAPALECHVGKVAALFRYRKRAGVEQPNSAYVFFCGYVRVTIEHDITATEISLVKMVAVRRKYGQSAYIKSLFGGEHIKLKHHAVHFGIAVSAHAVYTLKPAVEHLDDALWLISGRKVVARAMVKNIAEQKQSLRALRIPSHYKLFTAFCIAVKVGSNKNFHFKLSFDCYGKLCYNTDTESAWLYYTMLCCLMSENSFNFPQNVLAGAILRNIKHIKLNEAIDNEKQRQENNNCIF
jgi:hypothetical protein